MTQLALGVAAVALGALPAVAGAHGDVPEHGSVDDVRLDAVDVRRSLSLTRQKDALARRQATRQAATADPGTVGSWGPVTPWPVVAVHTALLQDGRVLAFDSTKEASASTYEDHTSTRGTVWDPATNTFTPANVSAYDLFCAGLAHLADGEIFAAGGNKNAALDGIRQTHVFDPFAGAWRRGPDMETERWYPSVTPLANGETLITDGVENAPDAPEVLTTKGTLRTLRNASRDLALYPWFDVAPDGRAFQTGPEDQLRSLDTAGQGSWSFYGARDGIFRTYGSRAMYDIGKVLVAGGGPSVRSAVVVDVNGAQPTKTPVEAMATGRRQFNLTVLADGSVLATGGNSSGAELIDLNAGVYAAELWDPATRRWRTLASEQVTRQYHSAAQLLLDGRVLSAGGGICGPCDEQGYLARDGQVFTPPYLYKKDGSGQLADRPSITSAPSEVAYGAAFDVGVARAGAVRKVALNRVSANTHSTNFEQRYVPLLFDTGSGRLRVQAPANGNIAPPGLYMLTVVDAQGVPSVARVVKVRAPASGTPSGPVLQMDFDETRGTVTRDATGGRPGRLRGARFTAKGFRGSALSLGGDGDSVVVPDRAGLDLTSTYTLEARVRPRSRKGWQTILFKAARKNLSYGLYATGGRTSRPSGWSGDAGVYGRAGIARNRWTHLVLTVKGGVGRLYVDGRQVAAARRVPAARRTSGALRIGSNGVWSREGFDGLIDEVRIWRRALTPAEIAEHAADGTGRPAPTVRPAPSSVPRACRRPGSRKRSKGTGALKVCADRPHRTRR